MKKTTLTLFSLLISIYGFSQVGISENFDSGTPAGWTDSYSNTSTQACAGNSERDNIYSGSSTGNITTPNQVGASNATDLTINFDYKIVDWSAATVATVPGWGTAELQYSTDDGATWTTVLLIDDSNHVTANTCATMMATIPAASLPIGSDVKLQIATTWAAGDYYFYVDNFSANQVVTSPPNCDSVLTETVDVNPVGDISWNTASGIPTGYFLTAGSSSGATDLANNIDVGNVTSYNLGALMGGATYFVTITPYNANGNATGCTEQSFTTFVPPANDNCANAIVITESASSTNCTNGLSGTTVNASNTSDYASCSTTYEEVWYAFTPATTGNYYVTRTLTNGTSTTYLNLWSGSCGTLTQVNSSCTTSSLLEPLAAGTQYYISVASFTPTVDFDICVYPESTTPPGNDSCASAAAIVPSMTGAEVWTEGTTELNTASGEVTDADMSCISAFAFGSGRDVWYQVPVPLSGEINVETRSVSGSPLTDTIMTVFSGTCGALVEAGCNDDGGVGNFSLVALTGQTPGATLYVRIQEYAAVARGPQDGAFEITAYAADPTLGLEDVAFEGFKYFPNPVDGTLSLRAQDNIQAVSVFNMLGQEVLRSAPNGLQDELDMSALTSGAYFLKVRINDVEDNFRIIKE